MKHKSFGTAQVLFVTTLDDLSNTQMRAGWWSNAHGNLITHQQAIECDRTELFQELPKLLRCKLPELSTLDLSSHLSLFYDPYLIKRISSASKQRFCCTRIPGWFGMNTRPDTSRPCSLTLCFKVVKTTVASLDYSASPSVLWMILTSINHVASGSPASKTQPGWLLWDTKGFYLTTLRLLQM